MYLSGAVEIRHKWIRIFCDVKTNLWEKKTTGTYLHNKMWNYSSRELRKNEKNEQKDAKMLTVGALLLEYKNIISKETYTSHIFLPFALIRGSASSHEILSNKNPYYRRIYSYAVMQCKIFKLNESKIVSNPCNISIDFKTEEEEEHEIH